MLTYTNVLQPVERITTVAAAAGISTDAVEDGIDTGWDKTEDVRGAHFAYRSHQMIVLILACCVNCSQTVKKILNPLVNLVAQLSDLIYFCIGLVFVIISTYSITEFEEYSCKQSL